MLGTLPAVKLFGILGKGEVRFAEAAGPDLRPLTPPRLPLRAPPGLLLAQPRDGLPQSADAKKPFPMVVAL